MSGLVLVVEDEPELSATLVYNLQQAGYQVRTADTGRGALAAATSNPVPDLIILDLILPDISGVEVCRRLRENEATRDTMIIMCSAKSDEIDRIVGFEVGADDYVVKPFSVRELILRIAALFRRGEVRTAQFPHLTIGPIRIDRDAHRVWIDGKEVPMTALEFNLLAAFVLRPGRLLSREQLLQEVWGLEGEMTSRTVDTHVKRLREKLGTAANYIETVRGVGYRFRD